jgi:hypothetical protein
MTKETHRITWRGIVVEIGYEPSWLDLTEINGTIKAHLDITAVQPERAPLPMTETGYRSHFPMQDDVADAGGPVSYVLAWLDHAAEDPAWKARQAAARQLTLF